MKKVAVKAFGCKVNQLEIEAFLEFYQKSGYSVANDLSDADLYIVGSCSVTQNAERKMIKNVRKALKSNPNSQIKIVGCFLPSAQEKLSEFHDRIEFIANPEKFTCLESAFPDVLEISGHTRAFLKIQEGCSSFCSYCIIPHLRQDLYSRPLADTIELVKRVVDSGKKEIVLVGIHLGLWADKGLKLADLLRELVKIEGDWRLRLTSLEVTEINDEIIELLAAKNRLVEHLHISLQSGSTRILEKMNRHYSNENFMDKIRKIREKVPFAGLSADIIVGFPGESEEDFQDTCEAAEFAEFMRIHIFPFSARPETVAASMPDKISPEIIKQREKKLAKIAEKLQNDFVSKFKNREVEVLIEEIDETGAKGYTREYLPIKIPDTNLKPNTFQVFKDFDPTMYV